VDVLEVEGCPTGTRPSDLVHGGAEIVFEVPRGPMGDGPEAETVPPRGGAPLFSARIPLNRFDNISAWPQCILMMVYREAPQ